MYDPVMSSFLSVDAYVQDPTSAQGFNRYSYCLNNPLRFTDPSGWQCRPTPPVSKIDWLSRPMEPRDFREGSPIMLDYYLRNGSVSYGGGSSGFAGTYGSSVVNNPYYITNNFYINRELVLRGPSIREACNAWWKDPSRETNQALVDAGISELNVGVLEKDGLRHGSATIEVGGEEYSLPLPTLEVGGNDFYIGVTAPSINLASGAGSGFSGLQKANVMAQSLGVPMGAITEGFECAAKSANGIPLLKPNSGLTSAQKVSALTKEGNAILKTSKFLGRSCAVVSLGVTGYQTYNYYYIQGGTGSGVFLKGLGDVAAIAIGVFGGPIGLGISIGYMIADWATDGFGVSYEIER